MVDFKEPPVRRAALLVMVMSYYARCALPWPFVSDSHSVVVVVIRIARTVANGANDDAFSMMSVFKRRLNLATVHGGS